jgi:hypothetical protein
VQIDNLSKRLKDAEERTDRDVEAAKSDIARCLSQIDSLTGKKPAPPQQQSPASASDKQPPAPAQAPAKK